jgi:hypothetical protein
MDPRRSEKRRTGVAGQVGCERLAHCYGRGSAHSVRLPRRRARFAEFSRSICSAPSRTRVFVNADFASTTYKDCHLTDEQFETYKRQSLFPHRPSATITWSRWDTSCPSLGSSAA